MTVLYFPGPIDVTGHWRRPVPPADIEGVIAELSKSRRVAMMTPVERDMVTDPEWLDRHRVWLATPEGQEYRAWRSRPWPVIGAEIEAEARAESLGKYPGATRGRGVIPDFYQD